MSRTVKILFPPRLSSISFILGSAYESRWYVDSAADNPHTCIAYHLSFEQGVDVLLPHLTLTVDGGTCLCCCLKGVLLSRSVLCSTYDVSPISVSFIEKMSVNRCIKSLPCRISDGGNVSSGKVVVNLQV